MPTAPILNEVTVNEQGVPSARLTAEPSLEAFGGGDSTQKVVSAGATLANTAGEIYDRHEALADQMFAQSADSQFKQIKNNLIQNSQNGLQTMKGQNAFGAPEEFAQRYKDDTSALMASGSNDRQRAVLQRLNARTNEELNAQVQHHVYAETQAFNKQTTDAHVANSIDDAVNNFQIAGTVEKNVSDIGHSIAIYGRSQGWSQDQIADQQRQANSKVYSGVIERMVNNGDDLLAKNYHDLHSDQMTAKDLEASEKLVETGTTRGESQRATQAILAQTSDEATSIQRARQTIQDPKVQDATVQRIRDEYNIREQAKRQRQENASDSAVKIIGQGGTIDDIPVSTLNAMTPAAQKSLGDFQRFKAQGVEPTTNWQKFYDLKTLASSDETRDQFAKTDLMTVRGQMANAQFQELVSLQAGVHKSDAASQSHLDGFLSKKQIADDALTSVGINPANKALSNKQQVVQYYQALDQSLAQFQESTGKRASNADVQKLSDQLLTKVVTDKGYLWDTTKYRFQVPPGQTAPPANTSNIPAATKQLIINKLKSRGINPTDDKVSAIFGQMKQGG